jgi:phytoene/squalene synthetase
MAAKADLS